ncbi:hypothetical protein [Lysinibacillus sp. LZ02]|uniref:hypothetical protein n=1 Tax=Lysinibacillus sp. LZ02 TaxID=3420668 RepID=UPI003D36450D
MWKMIVKRVNGDATWQEEIMVMELDDWGRTNIKPLKEDASEESAKEHAHNVINYFNSTLRPHKIARELVGVIRVENDRKKMRRKVI